MFCIVSTRPLLISGKHTTFHNNNKGTGVQVVHSGTAGHNGVVLGQGLFREVLFLLWVEHTLSMQLLEHMDLGKLPTRRVSTTG